MKLYNKTILVTGASGLIGSNLVDELMKDSSNVVIVMGRNKQKLQSTFNDYVANSNFRIVEHDVSNPFPNEFGKVDVIFHAAGPMERDVVLNKPVNVVMPNIIGTINCMNYALDIEKRYSHKVRVVLFSSVTVYSNSTGKDLVVTEEMTNCADSLDSPTISYSESKRMTEVIARSYHKQFGVDVVIARFSTVYGYTRNVPDTAFFEFVRKAWNGEDIVIKTAGLPKRDNVYVSDAVSGVICISQNGVSGEAYNISSGMDNDNFASVDEIAQVIANVVSDIKGTSRKRITVGDGNMVANRKPGLALDNSKLKAIGWQNDTDMYSGIKKTILLLSTNL